MASWFNSAWRYRRPIAVHNTGSTTYSIDIPIPKDWDDFWTNIQADGDDITLCLPDGFTEVTSSIATAFDLGSSFSVATRDAHIRLDKLTGRVANRVNMLWLYWGNPAEPATNTFGAWSSPATVFAEVPRTNALLGRPRIVTAPEPEGTTVPTAKLQKTSAEVQYVYWDMRNEMQKRQAEYNGSRLLEGIETVEVSSESSGSSASVVDATDVMFLDHGVVRTRHAGGTNKSDYTVKLVTTTTLGRVLDRRFLLRVRDPREIL